MVDDKRVNRENERMKDTYYIERERLSTREWDINA